MAAAPNEAVFNSQTSSLTIDPLVLDSSTPYSLVSECLTTDLLIIDLSSIDSLILDSKITDFSPSPLTVKGSRVKWQTPSYDDETLLFNLRLA